MKSIKNNSSSTLNPIFSESEIESEDLLGQETLVGNMLSEIEEIELVEIEKWKEIKPITFFNPSIELKNKIKELCEERRIEEFLNLNLVFKIKANISTFSGKDIFEAYKEYVENCSSFRKDFLNTEDESIWHEIQPILNKRWEEITKNIGRNSSISTFSDVPSWSREYLGWNIIHWSERIKMAVKLLDKLNLS